MRKSGSSSGSSDGSSSGSAHSEAYAASTNTSATTSYVPRTPRPLVKPYTPAQSRISKRATWLTPISATSGEDLLLFSVGPKPNPKRSTKAGVRSYHPSERRLNERQLRHQEMLGSFTMKFDRKRRVSHGARSDFSDISPCNSRTASLDIVRSPRVVDDEDEDPLGQIRRVSSIGGPRCFKATPDEDAWAAGVMAHLSVNDENN